MQWLCRWLGIGACVFGLAGGGAAAQEPPPEPTAAEPPARSDRLITMDFQDVDLPVLVKFISEITGKNFIVDDRVKGKVTIISPGKISVDEAYAVFQSVLQVKNFTTVPSGAIIKILPSQEAKSSTVETVFPGAAAAATDEFITKLMPLQNVDANNLLGIIQPLVSPSGLLAAYAPTNTLILIDSAANIGRISGIVHELDVAGFERGIEVVRLNYAFATELAATLGQVLEEAPVAGQPPGAVAPSAQSRRSSSAVRRPGPTGTSGATPAVTTGGEGQSAFKIIPDERTNSLIIVAGPLEMRRIRDLITRLDVPLPFGTGRIHVYYLKYANAFEIVPVLSDLIGGGGGIGGGLLSRGITGSTALRGGRLGQRGLGGFASDFGGGFGDFGGLGGIGSRAQRFGAAGSLRGGRRSGRTGVSAGLGGLGGVTGLGGVGGAAGGVATAAGGGGGEFEGEIRITADPSTNVLIINASPQDFETLKRVIEQLDVRRRQVYVEAIIMEVRLETQRALGIEVQGGQGLGKGVGFGRVNFGNINSAVTNPASLTGLILAAASNQTVRLPDGTVVPAQVALLNAAQNNTDVNILSAPNILTTDNQEAEIVVGQNLPFLASRSTSETNLANTFATIERRDVGITLRITPQISEGGMVRLDIFQEVSAVVPSAVVDANLLGPTTTIRSATTTVVVRNEQTVVIGGLISDDTSNQRSGIPYLSNIPVFGNLLRSTNSRREKINLLIFLTPHIIRDSRDHRDLSVRERDKLRAYMKEHRFRNLRPEQLEGPSWEPDLPPESPKDEEDDGSAAPREGAAMGDLDGTRPLALSSGRDLNPPPVNRYVLLAEFAERGAPPEGLQSASGLVAVALPTDSKLATLFRKGGHYRFHSDTFEGLYQCLEAYPNAQEALLVYPEGLPVDPSKGEYLHWREFTDPSSANIAAWSALH